MERSGITVGQALVVMDINEERQTRLNKTFGITGNRERRILKAVSTSPSRASAKPTWSSVGTRISGTLERTSASLKSPG